MPQTGGMIYKAKVSRIAGTKVYVDHVKGLGGSDDEFGPLNVLVPILLTPAVTSSSTGVSGTTGAGGGDSHTHSFNAGSHTHTTNVGDAVLDYFQKGDWVVVAQIGYDKEDLIVLGKLA